MPHIPAESYNAKGRQSTAGSRKKGKLKKKSKIQPGESEIDVNSVIHVPKSKEEKELERKERLRQEVRAYRKALLLLRLCPAARPGRLEMEQQEEETA